MLSGTELAHLSESESGILPWQDGPSSWEESFLVFRGNAQWNAQASVRHSFLSPPPFFDTFSPRAPFASYPRVLGTLWLAYFA